MTELEVLADPNLPRQEKRRFLPYPPHGLDAVLPLVVRTVEVDDLDVSEDAVDHQRCRIRPYVVPSWSRMRVVFELPDVDEALRARAFPAAEGMPVPLRHLLRVRCFATRYRCAASLRRDGDRYRGSITLHRDDVEKAVQIEAASVRGNLAEEPVPGRANERFAWLARSPRWRVDLEEGRGPSGGAFDFAWVDFGDPRPVAPYRGEDAGYLVNCPDATHHVVMRAEGPLVLLNRRHPAVAEVLSAKGTVGVRARLRDVLLGSVAAGAWRSILSEAVASFGDGVSDAEVESEVWADLGEEHWTTPVLRHAARAARCDRDVLLARLRNGDERPGFLFELSEKLGRVGSQAIRKLIEELDRT